MNTFKRRILPILVILSILVLLPPLTVEAQSPWFPSTLLRPAGTGGNVTGGGDFTPDQKGQILWGDDSSVIGDALIDGNGNPSGSFSSW